MNDLIESFLAASRFAVVGASTDRSKYGNKVLRAYQQNDYEVVPVNPKGGAIEGLNAHTSLADLDDPASHAVSVITPPSVTLRVIEEAKNLGIEQIWLQPGSESPEVLDAAREHGLDLIHSGPCVLVLLRYRE